MDQNNKISQQTFDSQKSWNSIFSEVNRKELLQCCQHDNEMFRLLIISNYKKSNL